MTWSLNASGHTPAPQGESWAEIEQRLHDELQAVLSKPEYGATGSSFAGNHVKGQPHVAPDAAPAEHQAPAAEHEHAAAEHEHEKPHHPTGTHEHHDK
jgi:hypothetical protein